MYNDNYLIEANKKSNLASQSCNLFNFLSELKPKFLTTMDNKNRNINVRFYI